MATTGRPDNLDVNVSTAETELREEPFLFEFFQAVRLLERLMPDKSPVGGFNPPGTETVQFVANSTLSFPPSEVHTLEWPEERSPRADEGQLHGSDRAARGFTPLLHVPIGGAHARRGILPPSISSIFSITGLFRFFIWLGRNTASRLPMNARDWTLFRTT